MRKTALVCLYFSLFFAWPSFGQENSESWEWYASLNFSIRQGVAEMAGLYAPKEPLIFIKELFAGFKETRKEQNTFATIKLRIVNNEGLMEKIISEYTNFKGCRHQCFIQEREINFFFPLDGSFLFGVEERTKNDKVSIPAVSKTEKKTPGAPKTPGFKEQERANSANSEKPIFSREEQPVP